MPVSDMAFEVQWKRLTENYLSLASAETVGGQRRRVAELLSRHDWIDDAVLERTVTDLKENVSGPLPQESDFLGWARLARAALEDDAEREARKALPPPAPTPVRPDKAAWERNVTYGIARQRNRYRLIDAYRAAQGYGAGLYGSVPAEVWKGQIEPTEAQIAAVVAERQVGVVGDGPLAGVVERLLGEWPR